MKLQKQKCWIRVDASKEQPENNQPVFVFDEKKNIKRTAFYVGEENKVVCEFGVENDEQMPDWLTCNEKTETYFYKVGWYEEVEQSSGYYDFIIEQRKVATWLKPQEEKYILSESELKELIKDAFFEGYVRCIEKEMDRNKKVIDPLIEDYLQSLNI